LCLLYYEQFIKNKIRIKKVKQDCCIYIYLFIYIIIKEIFIINYFNAFDKKPSNYVRFICIITYYYRVFCLLMNNYC